jgi:hypothetical protein
MGLFDIFTGDPAKDAAAKNSALLQANQTAGTNTLQQGQNSAVGALDKSAGLYGGLADKYGGATTLGLDALGVNGPGGNDRATAAFRSSPGYDYRVGQALDQTKRTAAASGMDVSGNTLAALSDRAGNMADQDYQTWLSNLQGYVSPELQATSGQAGRSQMRLRFTPEQRVTSPISERTPRTASPTRTRRQQMPTWPVPATSGIWVWGSQSLVSALQPAVSGLRCLVAVAPEVASFLAGLVGPASS